MAGLRAEAEGVDLSVKSHGGTPPVDEPRPVTAQDITAQLAQVYASPLD